MGAAARRAWRRRTAHTWVSHEPVWAPAQLPYNAAGDTRPGFECVHPLENGNGPCGGSVYDLADAIGWHACIVAGELPARVTARRLHRAYRRKRS